MTDKLRVDALLSERLDITRTSAQRLIKNGNISINGEKILKPSFKISPEQELEANIPPPEKLDLTPENIPFDVVFEDEFLIVLDKPAGLVVHPAPGNWTGTLVHGILYRYPDISCGGAARPGIVHRLDATTSGLMIVARESKTLERLQKMFQAKKIEKTYLALVHGEIKKTSGTIDAPIDRDPDDRVKMAVVEGGRNARTEYEKLWAKNGFSLLACRLISGRTHQIRVHLSAIGHPIVGDDLYGDKRHRKINETILPDRVFLHSWKLKFTHPITQKNLSFTRQLPPTLSEAIREMI